MKTDFTILWIDDNPQFVDALRPPLEKWMDDHGFGLIVHHRKSEAGIFDDLKKREIELIVLDYKLPKKKGDELIGEIRSRNFYQDIIFYSQDGIPNDVFNIPPDGVFFVDKGDAKDRIKDLIGLKIQRASDLATLRGWIVADAIELETILGRVLAGFFNEKSAMFTERVLSEDRLFDFGKKQKVLNGILKDHIAALSKSHPNSRAIEKLKSCKSVLSLFDDEIIQIRNALAHQMAEIHETGHKKIKTKTQAAKELVITPEKCIAIRKNVRKHLANLLELESLI